MTSLCHSDMVDVTNLDTAKMYFLVVAEVREESSSQQEWNDNPAQVLVECPYPYGVTQFIKDNAEFLQELWKTHTIEVEVVNAMGWSTYHSITDWHMTLEEYYASQMRE